MFASPVVEATLWTVCVCFSWLMFVMYTCMGVWGETDIGPVVSYYHNHNHTSFS